MTLSIRRSVVSTALSAAASKNTLAQDAFAEAKKLASGLSLGFLGEDSGGMVGVSHRRGPVKTFTADNVLKAMGFKDPAKTKDYGAFSFEVKSPKSPELWQLLGDAAMEPKAVDGLKKLLTRPDVKNVALVVTDDSRKTNFGANGYLVAQMKDGSLLVLRDSIGGMSF
ncbi:MAG: hypothetical protein JNK82_19885 [Myxococcaceae bacterium]|nr:hypothetical protein [Myxococcaceae bacterium]